MSNSCLFCLESAGTVSFQSPVPCSCRLVGHQKCFETWFETKGQIECPICHTISFPNPLRETTVRVIYINTRPLEQYWYRKKQVIVFLAFLVFLVASSSVMITYIAFSFGK